MHFPPKTVLFLSAAARKSSIIKALLINGSKVFFRKKYTSSIARIQKTICDFVPEEKRNDAIYMKNLIKDIYENQFLYMIDPAEYFLLGFANLTDRQKHEFVGNHEKDLLCRATRGENWRTLWDKNACYQRFQRYFKRDAIPITNENDRDTLFKFIRDHGTVIIKNARGSLGKSIQIVHDNDSEMNAYWESIRDSLSNEATYIAEELIVQCNEMGRFHPASVNTMRIMTFLKNGEVVFLGCFLRMGCGSSFVDNAGSGGILSEVDIQSGRVLGSGMSESGKKYDVHPDTGVAIRDYQIPKWQELLDLCKEMANVLEDQPYTGWDCALTDNGWVLVEANSQGQFLNQYPNGHGMRKAVENTFYSVMNNRRIM